MPDPAEAELPTPSAVRIIGLALLSGALIFAVIAVVVGPAMVEAPQQLADGVELPGGAPPPDPGEASTIRLLSLILAAYFPIALFISAVVLRRALASPPERFVALLITRWALIEGAAMFGTVIVLLAGMFGVLPGQPVYYLCLAPTAIFAGVVLHDLSRLRLVGGSS